MSRKVKILIVEDDVGTQTLLRKHLNDLGFGDIVFAEDGESALGLLEKEPFDLIVSDWSLPHMSGLELFQAVRKHRRLKRIPFVMSTATPNLDRVQQAKKEGIKHYLVKPIRRAVLQEKLEELLDPRG